MLDMKWFALFRYTHNVQETMSILDIIQYVCKCVFVYVLCLCVCMHVNNLYTQ